MRQVLRSRRVLSSFAVRFALVTGLILLFPLSATPQTMEVPGLKAPDGTVIQRLLVRNTPIYPGTLVAHEVLPVGITRSFYYVGTDGRALHLLQIAEMMPAFGPLKTGDQLPILLLLDSSNSAVLALGGGTLSPTRTTIRIRLKMGRDYSLSATRVE